MDNNKELFKNPPKNGRCVGHNTDMWFPHAKRSGKGEAAKGRENTHKAKAICSTCEVNHECLEYSLLHEPWGTWGGKTELERAAIRLTRNIPLSRDGKVFIPGLGNRSADGKALLRQPKSPRRRNVLSGDN